MDLRPTHDDETKRGNTPGFPSHCRRNEFSRCVPFFSPLFCPKPYIFAHIQVRGHEAAFSKEEVMKVRVVKVFSGFTVMMVAFLLLWQFLVVGLLLQGVDEVIAVFGRLL